MRCVHIINPEAGLKTKKRLNPGIEIYETKGQGDLEDYIYNECLKTPETHFTVYGGDGTVYEAVNGIMRAGKEAAEKAVLSIVPMGTGNDFVKNFDKKKKERKKVDIIKVNDRYCANMINIGFDCDVVLETDKIKKFPLTSGSFGYIVGVMMTLMKKLGKDLEITLKTKDGKIVEKNGQLLLSAIANGPFCGGGFKSNPAAKIDDGVFDALIVESVKKSTFLRLVSGYRKGTHIDSETAEVQKKYKNLCSYYQCVEMNVKNTERICIDGEIVFTDHADISIIRKALNVEMPAVNLFRE